MLDDYYYFQQLTNFIKEKKVNPKKDRVLVVCGGKLDDDILSELKFMDYLITSIDPMPKKIIKNFQVVDVEKIPFADNSYDLVIVHAGLHHCYCPHKGITEMYRVANKAAIIIEAQDSFIVNLLKKFGLLLEYESDAVDGNNKSGGVNNSAIPNYVYRFSKREIEKTIRSFDPQNIPRIEFNSKFIFYSNSYADKGNNHCRTSFSSHGIYVYFS